MARSKGEEKKTNEVDLCKLADAVAAVGPKLTKVYSSYLRSCEKHQEIIQLTPSTFGEFSDVKQATKEMDEFKVLTFGRGDPEDFSLKGYDISAKAIAELNDRSYCLIFVGSPEGKQDEVAETLLKSGISNTQLTVGKFVSSMKILKELFCEVDLCIMPSRTEGFGLTALEAMSAGLPILVSSNSGFGEALSTVPFGESFVVESEQPKEWAKAIAGVRKKKRSVRLQEIQQLRTAYADTFSWERLSNILLDKMWGLVNGFVGVITQLQQMQLDASKVGSKTDLTLDLKKITSNRGFKISDNEGSGNCMFYALSDQLEIAEGIKINHDDLRHILVQHLSEMPKLPDGTDLFHFVCGHQSWADYLRHMEKDGAWGDHVILCAAANHYRTSIRVVSSLPGINDVIIKPRCPVDKSKTLVLGHIHELHYVSLRPIQGSATVDGVKDDVQVSIGNPPHLRFTLLDLKDLPTSVSDWSDIELPVDILLLTVEDCEFLACYHYLNQPSMSYDKSIGYVHLGSMGHSQNKKLKTALVKCTQGSAVPGGSLTVVNDAVRILGPKAVFSVGTCIGLTPKEARLGDVVVSSKLTTLAHRTPVSRDIGNLIKHAAHGWRAPLKDPQARKVNVKCDATVLSIPQSQASSENIIQKYSEATAVEVEGEGVFAAAHRLKTEWVVVKGIKCFASDNQSSSYEWDKFASVMAASVVSNILRNPGVFQDWSHYNEAQPSRLKLEGEKTNTRWNGHIMVAGVVVLLSVFIAVLLSSGWIGS